MRRYVFRRPTDFRSRLALRVVLYPGPAAAGFAGGDEGALWYLPVDMVA
jgi:hypothetical protein